MFPKALLSVVKHLCLYVGLAVVVVPTCLCEPQQAAGPLLAAGLAEQIESDLNLIRVATAQHLSDEKVGYLWAVVAMDYRKLGNFAASESAYLKALDLQRDLPKVIRNYATTLDNFGTLYLVYGRLDEAEHYNRMGAKIRERAGLKLELARSEEHLAEIDLAKHRFKQAESEAAAAVDVMRAEKDPEPLDMIAGLNALAFTRCLRGRCAQGLEAAQESVRLARESFGLNSMPVAHAQMALGFAWWKSGRLDEAEPAMRSAIETMQAQSLPAGRPLLLALMEYRNYLRESRRDNDAEAVEKDLTTAKLQLSHECASCINARSLTGK